MAVYCAAGVAALTLPGVGRAQRAPASSTAVAAAVATVSPFALSGVSVVDVREGRVLSGQTVVVVGARIQDVGPSAAVSLPSGTRVIDGRGKYVIPGLWDMHFHTWNYPQVSYPLAIANGVTGVREMSHPDLAKLLGWRREIAAGTRIGPRAFVTGGYLGASNAAKPPLELKPKTPADAIAFVRSLQAAGVDFIKVRDGLPRELYFAALAEARRLGLPLVGHLPAEAGVTVGEASDSGQRTIEHVVSCPDDAATEEQCAALAARLRRNGTWVTPTLIAYRYLFGGVAPDRLRFWPDAKDVGPLLSLDPRPAQERQELDDRFVAGLATLVRGGVPFLAGTDAAPLLPEDTPGFSLHEELAWFVKAGMTPAAALQTATLNPALALHAADSLGTVAKGKLADLVLLTADPLADVANLDKIDAVVANGRYFTRAQLDALVADVERHGRDGPEASTP